MKNLNKDVFIYSALLILSVLLVTPLPHNSFSIIQYIIPAIVFEQSMIQLSGIVPLILYIQGIRGLLRQEYFAKKNKVLVVMGFVLIITPILNNICGSIKVPYYKLVNDVRSIDLEDSDIHMLGLTEEGLMVGVNLEVIDYSNTGNEFSVMLHFPKSWEDLSGQKQYEFKGGYHTSGHKNHSQISEKFIIPFKEGYSLEAVQDKSWFTETFKYELRSKDQVVTIIAHGV